MMKETAKTFLPRYMAPAFQAANVTVSGLVYAIHTDMTPEGNHADAYVAVDSDTLYILYGEEQVVRMQGARRIVSAFAAHKLVTHPLNALGELKCERLLTTARLWGEADGEALVLLVFSIGCLPFAERLIKVINNLRQGIDPLREVFTDEHVFCLKCGMRFPEPERKVCPRCLDSKSITRRLMTFFANYRKQVFSILAVMFLSTAVSILAPYISSKLFFDEVLTPGGGYYGMVGAFVALIILARGVTTGMNVVYQYVLAKTVPWIIYDLKLKIFEAMQRLSVNFYASKRTGSLMNRVTRDATNIYWFFVDGLPFVIVNIFTFTGIITIMCLMNTELAVICLIIIPISLVLFRVLWSVFRRFHHKNWVYGSQLNSMVSDSVNGQRVIKAFAREEEESNRFSGISRKQTDMDIGVENTAFTAFPLIYLFMFTGQVVITALGGRMVLEDRITIGTLMTFIAFLNMLYGPLEFMSWVSNWWARCVDSAQRVFEIIDAKPDVQEPDDPITPEHLRGDIQLSGVWFEYEPAVPVLKGLDLQVKAGTLLGIVGKTGAGKSTLANLIARLYDVTEGEIRIDGVPIKRLPLALLRANIGIVSQEIYLFIGTIADNIRYARPGASIEEVIRAAKAASAHDFIMRLPDAYETRVGAGGQDLSGGEKQRLSIARAILQNPRILILDEATAAMDTQTEAEIQASLSRLQKGRTTLSIAHRLSTLRDADSLAVIHEGRVLEAGTHAELIALKGEYHKLYGMQTEALNVISESDA
ncbi:MAG: ABC transporter ATP-binding protein/permease [Clostridia bacterium]|nr:ABC transporter ATP-binding protein/permease [Clostridia bacterium]